MCEPRGDLSGCTRTVALRAVLEAAELRWLCVLGTGVLSGEVAV